MHTWQKDFWWLFATDQNHLFLIIYHTFAQNGYRNRNGRKKLPPRKVVFKYFWQQIFVWMLKPKFWILSPNFDQWSLHWSSIPNKNKTSTYRHMIVTARAHSNGRIERRRELQVEISVWGQGLVVRNGWIWGRLPLVQTIVQSLAVGIPAEVNV